jgi:hypothetical protein
MHSTIDEKEPFTVCSPSLELDPVVDMVNHLIEDLDPNIPVVNPTESLDMYSFQSVFLPYDEDLLEAMVKGFDKSSHFCINIIKK